jgi:tetratricopeptide (TPR) repeat protein
MLTLAIAFSIAAAGNADYPLSCKPAAKDPVMKAWDAMFNSRVEDARALLKQALAADGKCAFAKSMLGVVTPGPDGNKLVEEAAGATAGLSEAEKLDLQATSLLRKGDPAKALDLMKKERDLVPTAPILDVQVAMIAGNLQKFDEQLAAAKKATELDPKSGAAWNMLGYANMALKKFDDAVAAFKKYVEIAPSEPNAHDSLADALMTAGKVDDAAKEYQKAIDGKMWQSYDGLAMAKAIQGDYDGARAQLAKQHDAAVEASDKAGATRAQAWLWGAQGNTAKALETIAAYRKECDVAKLPAAVEYADVLTGWFQLEDGKYADALASLDKASKDPTEGMSDAEKRNISGQRMLGIVVANARNNKVADAEKAQSVLEALAKEAAGDPNFADTAALGKAAIAIAKKDGKSAVAALSSTADGFSYAKLVRADAQALAGDKKAAADTRAALAKENRRDPIYVWCRAKALAAK